VAILAPATGRPSTSVILPLTATRPARSSRSTELSLSSLTRFLTAIMRSRPVVEERTGFPAESSYSPRGKAANRNFPCASVTTLLVSELPRSVTTTSAVGCRLGRGSPSSVRRFHSSFNSSSDSTASSLLTSCSHSTSSSVCHMVPWMSYRPGLFTPSRSGRCEPVSSNGEDAGPSAVAPFAEDWRPWGA